MSFVVFLLIFSKRPGGLSFLGSVADCCVKTAVFIQSHLAVAIARTMCLPGGRVDSLESAAERKRSRMHGQHEN